MSSNASVPNKRHSRFLAARLSAANCRESSGSCEAHLRLHDPTVLADLPANFPDVEPPRFEYGDRLRWKIVENTTDWGIAIGRFYSFAPHCRRWQWCYLIWLDSHSPSVTWVKADIAWEADLEPFEAELSA